MIPFIKKGQQNVRILLRFLLLFSGAATTLSGCVSSRELAYFQTNQPNDTLMMAARYTPKIQVGDILSVQVSSLNPEASALFNPYATMSLAERSIPTQGLGPNQLPYTPGYTVTADGTIDVPMIGKVAVVGLTTAQAADRIREKLKDYLKEPTVNIRNPNFRISVLGEVMRPSMFVIPNEQITLTEALGMAGDITIYGRRNNVLVIREENGGKKFARLDLTRRDLFRSPYYHLRPNDIVYVEPGQARATLADRTFQLIPIALSALSFIAIIVTR